MYVTSSACPYTTIGLLNIVMSEAVGSSKELDHSNSLVLVCLAFCSDGKDACLFMIVAYGYNHDYQNMYSHWSTSKLNSHQHAMRVGLT